jgi:molybdopterin synthase sulfur carrier subunit
MITLKLLASLRDVADSKELTVAFEPGGTVRDLIRAIGQVSPQIQAKLVNETGELSGETHILLSGRNVMWLDGLDTVIQPGTDITLIPPAAGG